jgi:hypothetical protein
MFRMVTILITLLTFFASAIGTTSGFGTSTIIVPILVTFLPTVETILLASIIHWFANIWKIMLFPSGFDVKLILLFGIPALLGSFFGAYFALITHTALLLRLLGLFLLGYAFFLFYKKNFKYILTLFLLLLVEHYLDYLLESLVLGEQ